MADLKGVLEMTINQIEPDQDAWKDQERRRRRRSRDRKLGVLAAAAILVAAGVFALTQRHADGSGLANPPVSSSPSAATFSPVVVGLDGTVRARLRQVPPDARSLTISPDGRTVAFVMRMQGIYRLATIGIDGTSLRVFPEVSTGLISSFPTSPGAMMPSWSSDGSQIVFTDGHVYVVNADGTGLKQLTRGPSTDLWPTLADRTVAYSDSGSQPLDDSGFSPTQEIWTVPTHGGRPTRLTFNHVPDDMPIWAGFIVYWHDGTVRSIQPNGAPVGFTRNIDMGSSVQGFNPRLLDFHQAEDFLYLTCCAPGRGADDGPLLRVHVYDVNTRIDRVLPGVVESDVDAPSWLSRRYAFVENRYTGAR